MVRGGRYGEKEALALEHNVAILGWEALPDLSVVQDRPSLATLLEATHPNASGKTRSNWESQIWPFLQGFAVGDLVVMPLKSRPAIAIGRVAAGGYRFRADFPQDMQQTRAVDWLIELPRGAFDQDLLYSFGAFMTVCRVQRNDAERRVETMLAGGASVSAVPRAATEDDLEASGDLDLESIARDQIRSLIARRFTGHRLTELVAALLQLQGYVTRQSPEGPDGGIDIIAGRGALGFDAPRLAVQVKSGDTPSDVRLIRELQGAMRNFGAEHGLFVSWRGFRGSAERETARNFFGIRLWTSDDVIEAIEASYDALPAVIQADLPLRRIWTVVNEMD